MRVISGSARGRALKSVPGTGTRPTTDKVKEAVFSMIGPYFAGGRVLDLFAGTGGLGIEALSRGMDAAVFIDMDRISVQVIRDNLNSAGLADKAEVYRNEAGKAIKLLAKRELQFDLIFLDPPYRMKDMDELVMQMEELGLLAPEVVIVIEHDAEHTYPDAISGLACQRRAEYGEAAVSIYTSPASSETE